MIKSIDSEEDKFQFELWHCRLIVFVWSMLTPHSTPECFGDLIFINSFIQQQQFELLQ